jgi:hypothetical protein
LPSRQPTESVVQLTRLLQSELSDLSRQDDVLRKLTRGLSHLLKTLQKDTVGGILGPRETKSLTSCVQTPVPSMHKINSFPALASRSGATTKRVRRACRIALMETDEAVTVEEIYLRIAQRGSFHFDNVYQAAVTIRQTLHLMTQQGEALVVDTNPRPRWKRINNQDKVK